MMMLQILVMLLAMPGSAEPLAEATRGITGTVTIELDRGMLRGRPDLDLDSPMLVRVASIRTGPDGRTSFDLEFIGTHPGLYDLRDVLVFADGTSIEELDPIPVQVFSHLGTDAASDLAMTGSPPSNLHGGYLFWLIVLAVLWLGIPIVLISRRLLHTPAVVVPPPPPPTLAQQLEPLVEAAANRNLSVPEQARLELLLYWHWQEQLGLEEPRPEAVARLRRHEDAGHLLRTIESWLHDPQASPPSKDDISTLLRPYREIPAGALS
ncbi:MAG: hypothetical protein MK116_08440 [Phycisphaerales bacterium]|nr:hypothetical protein [Phycisphaerales bacterium]